MYKHYLNFSMRQKNMVHFSMTALCNVVIGIIAAICMINLFTFVGAFGSVIAGLIKDQVGSYYNLFFVLIGLAILAMVLNLMIRKMPAKEKN